MRVDADLEIIIAGSLKGKTPFSQSRTAKFERALCYLICINEIKAKKRD